MHEQPSDIWLGSTISGGMYHVLAKSRVSTFGTRYVARSDLLGADVFIRVPPLELLDSDELRANVLENVRDLCGISMSRISKVIDLGFEDQIPFVVIQRPDGADICSMNNRSLEGLSQWLPFVANTLDELHGRGYRHCDVCPENIWIDHGGQITLSDFGMGQAVQSVLTGEAMHEKLFQPTEYLAPELIPADPLDGRCDQFSLAVSVRYWLGATRQDESADPELHPVLERATASDPNERYPSCSEFVKALQDAHAQNGMLPKTGSTTATPFAELEEFPCPGCGAMIARYALDENLNTQCPEVTCGLLLALDETGKDVVEMPFHCPRCRVEIPSRLFSGASQVACPASECGVSLEVDESGKALREAPLDCPVCKKPISRDRFDEQQTTSCPHCRQPLMLDASGHRAREAPPEISVLIDLPTVDTPGESPEPQVVRCPNCEEAIFKEALRGVTQTVCPKCSAPLHVSREGILTPIEDAKARKGWRKTAAITVIFLLLIGAIFFSGLSTNLREFVYDPAVKFLTGKNGGVTGAETDDTNASELARAEQFVKEGNDTEAIALLQQLLEDNPEDSGALKLKAEIEISQGKNVQAIATLTTAVRINLNDADAYLRRAKVNLLVKDYKRAISDCTDALRTNPDWKEAYLLRSEAYQKSGNTSRAERDRKRADSIHSD